MARRRKRFRCREIQHPTPENRTYVDESKKALSYEKVCAELDCLRNFEWNQFQKLGDVAYETRRFETDYWKYLREQCARLEFRERIVTRPLRALNNQTGEELTDQDQLFVRDIMFTKGSRALTIPEVNLNAYAAALKEGPCKIGKCYK